MKIKILLIFLTLNWIECLEVKDFCYKLKTKVKEFECNGDYSQSCGNGVCTKDENNCKLIALYYFFPNTLNQYMKHIKYCPKPPSETVKWKSNDVCSNSKNCFYSSVETRPIGSMLYRKCNCGGKYNYKCNDDYCGLDKRACDFVKIKQSISEIKKCQLFLNRN